MQIVVGLKGSFPSEPMPSHSCYMFDKPYKLGNLDMKIFPVKFNYDRSLCSPDKTMALVLFPADTQYWNLFKE